MKVKTSELSGRTILMPLRSDKESRRIYQCRCKCGNLFEAYKRDFNNGKLCEECSPPNQYMDPVVRILKQTMTVPECGCWIWTGKLNASGYGVARFGRKEKRIHRFMYAKYKGDPGELMVCHRCDVRSCINPDHLFLGTAADNIHDCMAKGRFAPGIAKREARKLAKKLGDEVDIPDELMEVGE
ncbi:HNH endonuclease signature motif containing protein [Atlantibacter hermannii]|uniref:HNH endonuclease signature motif containing protein n=1 Tax=Atlantibacter hermannii TaxID=565 RepID=UPI0028B13E4F|nr:HNH endonuclease signature motif containing protein [Atlantibacter hermannii]